MLPSPRLESRVSEPSITARAAKIAVGSLADVVDASAPLPPVSNGEDAKSSFFLSE